MDRQNRCEEEKQFRMEFARVVRLYHARTQEMLGRVGLLRGQSPVLGMLKVRDGMNQKELAHALNLSPATMTVTLKRMEQEGLIDRVTDEQDMRVIRVHLSEKGRVAVEQAQEQLNRVTAELLEGFAEAEKQQLEDYLCRIAHNMERVVKQSTESQLPEEE